jgi:uncharacterized protein
LPVANLKSQLSVLVELQTLDSEMYKLREEKRAKPEQIKALESIFEQKKAHLFELEKQSLEFQKQRKDAELELASKEEAGKKLQSQLFSLKTNKEYAAMLQQIQDAKADASLIEDKILVLFEQADKSKSEVEAEKVRLQGEEKVFALDKKKLEERVKEIDDRLSQLEAQRKQVVPGVDEKILAQYERILSNRDGLAIVEVRDNSCKGCNMSVPPQVINLIQMYERIITCEICNRMLYVQE